MSFIENESSPGKGCDALPPADLLWGAAAIAHALNCDTPKVQYMLRMGQLKSAKKIGGKWVCSRSALLRELGAG